MTDRETLKFIGDGIMQRVPNIVRVRAGQAAWKRLYDDLKACEYEYEFVDVEGQRHKAIMCFRRSMRGLSVPNLMVYGKAVELDDTLPDDGVAFDGREVM